MNEIMNTSLITGLGKELKLANEKVKRLQKAVDFAVDYLEQVATHAKSEEDNFAAQVIERKIDEIKQLIKGA